MHGATVVRVIHPESIDLLFWPLVIFAIVVAAAFVAIVAVVMVMARRNPGVHIQHAETGGKIENKPSTRTTPTLDVGGVNVDSPQLPGGGGA